MIRIDERTATLVKTIEAHLVQNRDDFKDVHVRINKISSRQSWVLGLGAGIGAALSLAFAWAKNMMNT